MLLIVGGAIASGGPAAETGTMVGAVQTEAAEGYCSATAFCWDGSSVSCNGVVSCVFHDSNCATYLAGYVTCDGVTTSCPICPPCPHEDETCTSDADCVSHVPPCNMCSCRFSSAEALKPPTEGICICP
jgi:hypothetical protein